MKSKLVTAEDVRMNTEVKEKLRWFQMLASLYDIATPHIEAFTGLKCQVIEQRVIDTEVIDRNTRVLRKLLALTENMPEPPEDEMSRIKKHFETAVSSCINASESLIKYVQLDEHDAEIQNQLDNLLNSLLTARHHSESTYRRLNSSPKFL
jgi:hypothetical protein